MKRWSILFSTFVILMAACTPTPTLEPVSEEPESSPAAIVPFSEMHILSSDNYENDFLITVGFPLSYGASDQTYPVLYMLDGNIEFAIGQSLAPLMAFGQEAPEVIVVGIGYAVEDIMQVLELRARDLPPTETDMGGGGAEAFLAFITDELKPYVEENFAVDTGKEILFGHSDAGLFATYAMFQDPGGFEYYIIGSPTYYWDDGVMFSYEAQYAAANSDLSAKVFIGVGAAEEFVYPMTQQMVDAVVGREYPSLSLELMIFEDGLHFSTLGGTMGQGLFSVLSMP